MNFKNFREKIKNTLGKPYQTDQQIISSTRGWLVTLILLGTLLILKTPLLFSTKFFNINNHDILAYELQDKSSEQGGHFLLGMLSGFVFSHPATGISIGILKEIADIIEFKKHGGLNSFALWDSLTDLIFWGLGGFAGYYGIDAAHHFLYQNKIDGVSDLAKYSISKLKKKIRKKKKEIFEA